MNRRLAIAALVLLPALAVAAPTLSVRPDRTETVLGNPITLTIRASNDTGDSMELAAPPLDDWAIVGRQQSTRVDGIRGTRVLSLQLTLQPRRTGELTIGAFAIGTAQRSAPITITVKDADLALPETPAGQGDTTDEDAPEAGSGGADRPPDEVVFFRWEVDDVDVWLGEQLDARLVMYIRRGLSTRNVEIGDIDLTGFWTEGRETQGRQRGRMVTVGGLRFERHELFRYSLFPLRAGTVSLPAVGVELLARRQALFSGYTNLDRKAEAVSIEVRPLPRAGRPAGFAGPTVGSTRLTARVGEQQIKGDAGTELTVITRIDGMIQNVPPIELPELEDFTVFPAGDDTRRDKRRGKLLGVRSQRWLLRPKREGKLTIPAFELPWFDPQRGTYDIARTAPLTVQVTGAPTAVADDGPGEARAELALRDVGAVDPDAGPAAGLGLWFDAALFGAPALFLIGLGLERARRRRDATAGSRAAKTAARDATRRLTDIKRKPDGRAGYAAIAKVIIDYLEARFGRPFNGLTRDAIRAELRARGVSDAATDPLLEELDAADFARFAPSADAERTLLAAADRATVAIEAVEREAT